MPTKPNRYERAAHAARCALEAADRGPWPNPDLPWDPWTASRRHRERVREAKLTLPCGSWGSKCPDTAADVAALMWAVEEGLT